MCHAWKRRETNTRFWSENMNKRAHLPERGLVWSIIIRWNLIQQDGKAWTEFI